MVEIHCDNEDCPKCGVEMDHVDTDSRGDWTENIYECSGCGRKKIHRTEYDQIGLIENETIYDAD